jgi:hypothetical protein
MRFSKSRYLRAAQLYAPLSSLLVVTTLLLSRPAAAQDPFAGPTVLPAPGTPEPPAPGTTAPVPEGVKGEVHESLPRPKAAEAEEPPPVGPVERLPPTAYPEWKTRGIYGGSLWMTFHGMPWPYYPKTGIGISGYAWVDTGYEQVDRGVTTETAEIKYLLQQGRAVLRATPTYSRGPWYVQGQAELVANKDQTQSQSNGTGIVDIDDLWIRTGYWHQWDVTLGRFEGFEVYHFGMGMDLNTLERRGAYDDIRPLPDIHGLLWGQYRPPNVGNAAFHYYFADILRFELLGQVGNDVGLNTVGVRPAAILDLGVIKVKGAAEIHRQSSVQSTYIEARHTYGATGAVQFVLDPFIEGGLNFDYGYLDHWKPTATIQMPGQTMGDYDPAGSYTQISFGGFVNARVMPDVLVGAGANYISQEDAFQDAVTGADGKFTHLQAFGAIQYLVNKQLFIKFVGAYARAHIAQSNTSVAPWDNSMVSARVRFLYLF